MKQLAPIKKYYLLKGLLILSFYINGRLLDFVVEELCLEEIFLGYGAVYVILFNVSNFLLVRYAYKEKLGKVLWISLFYNGIMANPFLFTVIDYYLSHSGTDFSFCEIMFFGALLTPYLHTGLAVIVFIANIICIPKLKQRIIKEYVPAPKAELSEEYKEVIHTIIGKVKEDNNLQTDSDSLEMAKQCGIQFESSDNEIFGTIKRFAYDADLMVAFIYKKEALERLEFYYQQQQCHVEQIACDNVGNTP